MGEVTISVRGEHQVQVPAELGIVHVAVSTDGPERPAVVERAVALSEPLRADLARRKDAGQVREWFSERVAIRSERPWSDGRYLAPVHYASVDFKVTFEDSSELSMWVSEIAELDGIQVGHISWQLTPQTAQRVEREVATQAVQVAVERATAYANALGKQQVVAVQLADLGLLSREHASSGPQPRMAGGPAVMAMAADSVGPGLDLHPQELTISAAVEARFSAS